MRTDGSPIMALFSQDVSTRQSSYRNESCDFLHKDFPNRGDGTMKIGVGADPNGLDYQDAILNFLSQSGHDPVRFSCDQACGEDYPDVAQKVGEAIIKGEIERGILICGTGIGMAISANKIPGIRAACCHDIYSAERAQLSNNAQILTLGEQVIGIKHALRIVEEYVRQQFKDGRSTRKIKKIMEKEAAYLKKGSL